MSCVTGPLQHPWTLSKTQSHTRLQKGAMKIFFFFFFLLFTKTYLFISRRPSTPCSAAGIVLDDAGSRALPSLFFFSFFFFFTPPSSFNTTAVENQTALKQIDVLFNIVVTSSQGPRASASVTTAGLLSLARRWLPLCWSLQ